MPNIPNLTSPLLPPLQTAGQEVHKVFPTLPVIPPNGTQDLLSKGIQKVRELINHQRSGPAPTDEQLKQRQRGMVHQVDSVAATGTKSEQPDTFENRIDVHNEEITEQTGFMEQHEFGEGPVTQRTVNTGKSYTSPADRIDRDIFLIDTFSGESLRLPFIPKELKYNPESNFKAIASMGRNNPLYHFTGAEDSLEFEIDWFAEKEDRSDVIKRCKWVEALSKNDGYNNPPPAVILHWNTVMFSDSLWLVTAAPYKMTDFQAHKKMLPQQAYQQVTLKRITEANMTGSQILSITI